MSKTNQEMFGDSINKNQQKCGLNHRKCGCIHVSNKHGESMGLMGI